MIKKALLLPLFVLLLSMVFSPFASAHVLKTDGTIGAVLHVKPDDAPVAQTPITYELSFQDSKGNFSLTDCACSIAFATGGKITGTQQLDATTPTLSRNTYTFPESGMYTFSITGSPKNNASFRPFHLTYSVRVGGQAGTRGIPLLLWVGMAMGIGLLLLSTYASEYATSRPKQRGK